MNLAAMLILTAVIAGEKLLPHGIAMSRAVAVLAVALALAFAISPALAAQVVGS